MKIARIQMDANFLKQLLNMPITSSILDATYDQYNELITLTVHDDELKNIEEGDEIPLIKPIINVIRWDWNQGDDNG